MELPSNTIQQNPTITITPPADEVVINMPASTTVAQNENGRLPAAPQTDENLSTALVPVQNRNAQQIDSVEETNLTPEQKSAANRIASVVCSSLGVKEGDSTAIVLKRAAAYLLSLDYNEATVTDYVFAVGKKAIIYGGIYAVGMIAASPISAVVYADFVGLRGVAVSAAKFIVVDNPGIASLCRIGYANTTVATVVVDGTFYVVRKTIELPYNVYQAIVWRSERQKQIDANTNDPQSDKVITTGNVVDEGEGFEFEVMDSDPRVEEIGDEEIAAPQASFIDMAGLNLREDYVAA